MSRTSDKHSPRKDEQLEREEHALLHGAPDEGRTEPRRGEAPGPDEGGTGVRPEVDDRATLAASFRPATFPARRDRLVEEARDRHADEQLVSQLQSLPDRIYETVGDVWEEMHRAQGS